MKRTLLATALLSMVFSAHAGPYGDDLSKCLIKSTDSADKSLLVEWIFFAIALNPTIAPLANIPAAKRDDTDRRTAKMFERLLVESCLDETRQAVKYEGTGAVSEAFKLLGQVASQEMFGNPAVAKGTENFARYIDGARLEKAFGTGK